MSKRRNQNRGPRISFKDALDINDAADMPEGAAWALAEEMAGLEPGDGTYALDLDGEP